MTSEQYAKNSRVHMLSDISRIVLLSQEFFVGCQFTFHDMPT